MSDLSDDAKNIAAQATGLRPDQIERAVEEYRKALNNLDDLSEPKWMMQGHMSYRDGDGDAWYFDPEGATAVTLFVENRKSRSGWKQYKTYGFSNKGYDTYVEARGAELKSTTRPKSYAVAEGEAN